MRSSILISILTLSCNSFADIAVFCTAAATHEEVAVKLLNEALQKKSVKIELNYGQSKNIKIETASAPKFVVAFEGVKACVTVKGKKVN